MSKATSVTYPEVTLIEAFKAKLDAEEKNVSKFCQLHGIRYYVIQNGIAAFRTAEPFMRAYVEDKPIPEDK